jgi:hypothetical protein
VAKNVAGVVPVFSFEYTTGVQGWGGMSFIRIKAPFLKKCARLPSAFSEWAFPDNVGEATFSGAEPFIALLFYTPF